VTKCGELPQGTDQLCAGMAKAPTRRAGASVCIERLVLGSNQLGDLLGVGDQRRPDVADQPVTARAGGARHRAGYGPEFAAEGVSVASGVQGTRPPPLPPRRWWR
jgi:hypothetical protein